MSHGPSLSDVLSQLEGTPDSSTDSTSLTNITQSSTCPRYSVCDFYNFLKRSHCEENLEFYRAAKRFLVDHGNSERLSRGRSGYLDSIHASDSSVWEEEVYEKFIRADSPLECNFPQHIRDTFDLYHERGLTPPREDVADAIEHVLKQLRDAFSKYLAYIRDSDLSSQSGDGSSPDSGDCSNVTSETESDLDSSSVGKQTFDIMELNRGLADLKFDDTASFFLGVSSSSAEVTSSETARQVPKCMTGGSHGAHSIDAILAEKPVNVRRNKLQHSQGIIPTKKSIFNKLHGERRRGTSPIKMDIYEAPGSVLTNFQTRLKKFLRQEHARKHTEGNRPVVA